MQNIGENYEIENDLNILAIKSPISKVGGPYVVIAKSIEDRWAIVALDWEDVPCIGIRQFWGVSGSPFGRDFHATWFILPHALNLTILSGLSISPVNRERIERFLIGDLSGDQLVM